MRHNSDKCSHAYSPLPAQYFKCLNFFHTHGSFLILTACDQLADGKVSLDPWNRWRGSGSSYCGIWSWKHCAETQVQLLKVALTFPLHHSCFHEWKRKETALFMSVLLLKKKKITEKFEKLGKVSKLKAMAMGLHVRVRWQCVV